MTKRKNFREIMEALMNNQEGTRNFSTNDANEILKRLGFKDDTRHLTHAKARKGLDTHGRSATFTHRRLPNLRLNISRTATLSWGDKKDFIEAVKSLLEIEPNALEKLEPGYAVRIAQEEAEQNLRQ